MKHQFSPRMPIGQIYPKGRIVQFLDRDRHRKWTSKLIIFLWNSQLLVTIFLKRAWAGLRSSMFLDKSSDFSASFVCNALFSFWLYRIWRERSVGLFSPHSKDAVTFDFDQNYQLKDDRKSLLTDLAVSLKLIRLADRRQLHQIMHNSLKCPISGFR
jgi:hypothetical protein